MADDFVPGYTRGNVHRLVIDMYIKHRLNTVGGETVEVPNLDFFDKNKRHSPRSAILDITYPHFAFKRRVISKYLPLTASKMMTIPIEYMLVFHNYANSMKPIPKLRSLSSDLSKETTEVLFDHLNYMYGNEWLIQAREDVKGRKVVPLFNAKLISKEELTEKIAETLNYVYQSSARFRLELREDSFEIDMAYVDSKNRFVRKENIKVLVK